MTDLVAQTLRHIFQPHPGATPHPVGGPGPEPAALCSADVRRRPDFAESRPVVFRSEAFAEDLQLDPKGVVGGGARMVE